MFHGAWAWQPVRSELQSCGFDVFTPTLTGMGDRRHLAGPQVGLRAHARDIEELFYSADLHDAILVGHSLSGSLVVTAAAERLADRIAGMVFVDGPPVTHGWNFWDHWPQAREIARPLIASNGWQLLPPDPAFWGIEEPTLLQWVREQLCPVALATCDEHLDVPLARYKAIPRLRLRSARFLVHDHLWATTSPDGIEDTVILDAPHEMPLTHPKLVSDFIARFGREHADRRS